jgi:ribokinase
MSVCVLGSINWDIVAHVAALPRRGETILSHRLTQSPGGKGLNQAVAAARFGGSTRLIGALGRDAYGAQLRAFLRAEDIGDADVRDVEGAPTGQAYICLAENGDNQIVVTQGANAAIDANAVQASVSPNARVFLTQFETPPPVIEAFFRTPAAQAGTKILNAAPALMEGKYLFPLADILIVNETELAHFSGHKIGALDDVVPAARALSSTNQTIIVTLGADGAMAVKAEGANHVPGHAVVAIDTVGAGDCFCGVFAASLAEGAPLAEAMRLANTAAALSVGRFGAAQSMPTRQEVFAFAAT